jgi:type II secretory pathway pseudopilin PulG
MGLERTKGRREDHAEAGVSGIVELVVVLVVIGILFGILMPTFLGSRSSSNDHNAQQLLNGAATAAQNVYNDSQDYGAIGGATSPTAKCATPGSTSAPVALANLTAYDTSVTFTCSSQTAFANNSIVYTTGELASPAVGGWIGMATESRSGTCWQVFIPANTPPTYGSTTTASCAAPTAALTKTSW